jgi:hypothetical protein
MRSDIQTALRIALRAKGETLTFSEFKSLHKDIGLTAPHASPSRFSAPSTSRSLPHPMDKSKTIWGFRLPWPMGRSLS